MLSPMSDEEDEIMGTNPGDPDLIAPSRLGLRRPRSLVVTSGMFFCLIVLVPTAFNYGDFFQSWICRLLLSDWVNLAGICEMLEVLFPIGRKGSGMAS